MLSCSHALTDFFRDNRQNEDIMLFNAVLQLRITLLESIAVKEFGVTPDFLSSVTSLLY
jgi:hypothetical protein